jgi:hypothetical protein
LRADDVAARRAVTDAQSRHVSLAASRETLSEFAMFIGAGGIEGTTFEAKAGWPTKPAAGGDLVQLRRVGRANS